MLVVLH
jgi:hypothetical protein